MELTRAERAMLERAHTQRMTTVPSVMLLGVAIVVTVVAAIGWFRGWNGFDEFNRSFLFLWVASLLYQLSATQEVAHSLIVKLDGARAQPAPSVLGLNAATTAETRPPDRASIERR